MAAESICATEAVDTVSTKQPEVGGIEIAHGQVVQLAMTMNLGAVITLLAVVAPSTGKLAAHPGGRWMLLFALVVVPLVLTAATLTVALHGAP